MNQCVQNKIFDFVFIGMGASNSLILISLIKKGLLVNKKVAVFESDKKTKNDKTYCFWANPEEPIVHELDMLISRSFTQIKVNPERVENISNRPYHYIRSIDLYNATRQFLAGAQIEILYEPVHNIQGDNSLCAIQTNSKTYQSKYVFDSRPPIFDTAMPSEISLFQSFYGLHVKCDNEVFQEDTFEMMNFNIPQDGNTQFIYVIPFSKNEALIEFTRFGAEKIEKNYAINILDSFIRKTFGTYKKLDDEKGVIPMTTHLNPPSEHQGILNTGARANLIKPSTGYGFKNMFQFAIIVTKCIESEDFNCFNNIELPRNQRFKFYDRLLLLILLCWPSLGMKIFSQLYNKISIGTIFTFLEEKTALHQEIKIFAALPLLPFIKSLYLYLKSTNILRYLLALVFILVYLILIRINAQIATFFSYSLLIIGLLWIGIPHGALDHLLSKSKRTPLLLFITKYLLIVGVYLALWQFSPLISFFVFILYSAFHFGESELVQNKEQIKSFLDYAKAGLLGLCILSFIIFSHLNESVQIISYIIDVDLSNLALQHNWYWPLFLSLFSLCCILGLSFYSKKGSHLGLLMLLLLGSLVPLPLAFGLYFILQHSHNAWRHLKIGLGMNSMDLYKKSLVYTLGALVIFIIITFFIRDYIDLSELWANFFIFLACISLPHFVLMHLFYANELNIKKKSQ
jgi:lycopene beta-cyclase